MSLATKNGQLVGLQVKRLVSNAILEMGSSEPDFSGRKRKIPLAN